MNKENIEKLCKTDNIVVIPPYQNEPNEIQICDVKEENGVIKLLLDPEFTIIPSEWYGVHNWYEKQANYVLNELLKLRIKNQTDANILNEKIDMLIQTFYEKRDTRDDIPERTKF